MQKQFRDLSDGPLKDAIVHAAWKQQRLRASDKAATPEIAEAALSQRSIKAACENIAKNSDLSVLVSDYWHDLLAPRRESSNSRSPDVPVPKNPPWPR